MFFRVQNGEGMIAEGKDGGVGGGVGFFPSKNHPAVAKVQTVKEA
jgi:hypothetical protein